MATTSPDGLISPDASDPYDLTSDMAAMQASTQAALVNRASKSGSNTQMLNASGVQTGTLWYNTSEQRLYRYNGTGWDAVAPAPSVEESYTYSGGTSSLSSLTLVLRRRGVWVEVSGSLSLDSSWSQGNKKTIISSGGIPSAWRPPGGRVIPATLSSTTIHRGGDLVFNSSGSVVFGMSDAPPTSTAMLFSGVYLPDS